MEIDFKKLMSTKSDAGLQDYLDNRTGYTQEAVEAAIAEMQKRGRIFPEEELRIYGNEFREQREAEAREEKELFKNQWKKNVVTDENAPAYYSERAIYMFSAFFSVLFGAVLLATNFRSTESKKGIWQVMAYGVIYTGLQFWILSMLPSNSFLTLVFSTGGALIMNHLFWKKYIGQDTKYRAKPIWKPLAIGLLIILLVLVLLSSPEFLILMFV